MITVMMLHIFCCLLMTGVIWVVQLVVYPLFKHIGPAEFKLCHQLEMKQISIIVVPVMLLELVTGVWLLYEHPSAHLWWNISAIAVLWLWTGFRSIPAHDKLEAYNEKSKRNLVMSNWLRTGIWSIRSIFWGTYLLQTLRGEF